MSAIEKYKAAKEIAGRLELSVASALGRDRTDNDKHRVDVTFCGIKDASFSPMNFDIDASYGYYGSSSCTSASSKELGAYLAAAIRARLPELLDEAVRTAKENAIRMKQAARVEAQQILEATT